jgi:hypothetical protein
VLGELSLFHQTHGFYVHGVPISAATLPAGWEQRLIRVSNPNTLGNTGLCLESHDVAASKLVAFREKDRDFVRVLLGLQPPCASSRRSRGTPWVSRESKIRLLLAHRSKRKSF